jgi:hypothetical protein
MTLLSYPSVHDGGNNSNHSKVFDNRVLRGLFEPTREEVAGENCIARSVITSTFLHIY